MWNEELCRTYSPLPTLPTGNRGLKGEIGSPGVKGDSGDRGPPGPRCPLRGCPPGVHFLLVCNLYTGV